ncbi:PRC-barrel domain-containing protein [Heliobacterium mobile]|nr:PRC-barrel domain-containing protein [Heliobacterium mobile]
MIKSQQIIGLAIISIGDGRELGTVRDVVVNPDRGCLEYLMVEDDTWYLGAQILPFEKLRGLGEHAVTIESDEALQRLTELPEVLALFQRNIKINGTKVLTKRGRLLGMVDEYLIDETTGKITGSIIRPLQEGRHIPVIPAESVVTYGRDVLIVNDELDAVPSTTERPILPEPSSKQDEKEAYDQPLFIPFRPLHMDSQITEPMAKGEYADPVNPNDSEVRDNEESKAQERVPLFGEQQHKFFIGKIVTKTITNNLGDVLAEAGSVITEELIGRIKQAGKYLELIMNVRE